MSGVEVWRLRFPVSSEATIRKNVVSFCVELSPLRIKVKIRVMFFCQTQGLGMRGRRGRPRDHPRVNFFLNAVVSTRYAGRLKVLKSRFSRLADSCWAKKTGLATQKIQIFSMRTSFRDSYS